MAAITAHDCVSELWIQRKFDDFVMQLTGVASYTCQDVDYYDGSTHSLVVDANMLGNAHIQISQNQAAQTLPEPKIANVTANASGWAVLSATHGIQALASSDNVSVAGDAIPPASNVLNGAVSTHETTDAAFKVGSTDLVPAPTKRTASLITWWDEAGGTGNVVAMVWLHELAYVGPTKPVRP